MTKEVAPILIRDARPGDLSFVFSSWLRSYRETRNAKVLDNRTYYAGQHRIIEKVIERAHVLVATSQDDSDQILGYIIYEHINDDKDLVVHWLYTKLPFRNYSIAKQLLQTVVGISKADKVIITHLPKLDKKIFLDTRFLYNPYIAWLP